MVSGQVEEAARDSLLRGFWRSGLSIWVSSSRSLLCGQGRAAEAGGGESPFSEERGFRTHLNILIITHI